MKTLIKKNYARGAIVALWFIKLEEESGITTTRMAVAIFEKRCDCYAHPCKDEYKRWPKGPIYRKDEGDNPKIPKHNPRR